MARRVAKTVISGVAARWRLQRAAGAERSATRAAIAADPAFQRGVAELAERLDSDPDSVATEALGYLDEIVAVHSEAFPDFSLVLSRIADRRAFAGVIRYDGNAVDRLRERNEQQSLVLLSGHRSYLDFVLRVPLAEGGLAREFRFAGANIDIWPVGTILRSVGMVFVRRGYRNPVYWFVQRQYMAWLTEHRANFWWAIEGGRSRTGKLLRPKAGLLTYLAEAIASGHGRDVALVPATVVWEYLHEVEEFAAYGRGAAKVPESLMLGVRLARGRRDGSPRKRGSTSGSVSPSRCRTTSSPASMTRRSQGPSNEPQWRCAVVSMPPLRSPTLPSSCFLSWRETECCSRSTSSWPGSLRSSTGSPPRICRRSRPRWATETMSSGPFASSPCRGSWPPTRAVTSRATRWRLAVTSRPRTTATPSSTSSSSPRWWRSPLPASAPQTRASVSSSSGAPSANCGPCSTSSSSSLRATPSTPPSAPCSRPGPGLGDHARAGGRCGEGRRAAAAVRGPFHAGTVPRGPWARGQRAGAPRRPGARRRRLLRGGCLARAELELERGRLHRRDVASLNMFDTPLRTVRSSGLTGAGQGARRRELAAILHADLSALATIEASATSWTGRSG